MKKFFVFCASTFLFLSFAGVSSHSAYQPDDKKSKVSSFSLFAVQLSSRKKNSEVELLRKKLTEKGFPSYVIEKTVNGALWYRIRIGFFISKSEAKNRALEVLKAIPELKEYLVIAPSTEEIMNQQ